LETQAQTVLTLGLDQITGLTQNVFRLDRVKSSSCDCPAKIPVDIYSNASCFTCFSSGSSSPDAAEFCPTLRSVNTMIFPSIVCTKDILTLD
jgi:hypothetical protein